MITLQNHCRNHCIICCITITENNHAFKTSGNSNHHIHDHEPAVCRTQSHQFRPGFPDFEMNEELIQRVCASMKQGNNQYVHMNGLLQLRISIAEKTKHLYDASIDSETQITITPGGTYAIYSALTSILQPGDEVIVFEPAYDSYIPNIEINQAKAIRISLPFPDFNIPWSEVKNKINHKTKALIINSPNNPTGSIL